MLLYGSLALDKIILAQLLDFRDDRLWLFKRVLRMSVRLLNEHMLRGGTYACSQVIRVHLVDLDGRNVKAIKAEVQAPVGRGMAIQDTEPDVLFLWRDHGDEIDVGRFNPRVLNPDGEGGTGAAAIRVQSCRGCSR